MQLRRPSAIDRHIDIDRKEEWKRKGNHRKERWKNREMKRKSMNLKGA